MIEHHHSSTSSDGRAPASPSSSTSSRRDKSLVEMMDEATARLARMELSCRDAMTDNVHPSIDHAMDANGSATDSQVEVEVELLQLQVTALKQRLVEAAHDRDDHDAIFQRAMQYAAAKGTANAVLHTLFDQASAGKYQVLEHWLQTGVIPTRDGLKHWRLDVRTLRNEAGASMLHVAVDASIARQNLKLKCVELLVDRVGFDVNVRDAFGRTPLHVAAMAGYAEVTQALLARGADATRRDRAGLTPLSVVRTLSRPPEEVVQLLALAESEASRQLKAASDRIAPQTALASALFLRGLRRFVRPAITSAFSRQIQTLLELLLTHKHAASVAFDQLLRQQVPLLFETQKQPLYGQTLSASEAPSLVRLEALFLNGLYRDPHVVNELYIEAAAYGQSLGTTTSMSTSAVARAGATWEGFLLKLIQAFNTTRPTVNTPDPIGVVHGDAAISETPPRSPVYADQSITTTTTTPSLRQAWHYAVLFKASTQPFPGVVQVTKGQSTATASADVGRFFPLHDRLLLGATEYHCVAFEPTTRVIQLDRAYEGVDATDLKAYLVGACSSLLPPYIAAKRIWERAPGNKYEDHMSLEQDLFQDYQFLDPDSAYEVAVKLGPVATATEARAVVGEWKTQARRLFEARKCQSGLSSCEHYCPQRSGHSLCVETMAAIGRGIAKERLGRATYAKQLKPRASLQKYQDLYLGNAPWPGSPSTTVRHFVGEVKTSPSPDFT